MTDLNYYGDPDFDLDPDWEPDFDFVPPGPRRRYRGGGVLFLCRKCAREVGFVRVLSDGTHSEMSIRCCPIDKLLEDPTDREMTKAVAKALATDRPVKLRLAPVTRMATNP